jgi:molecular chaperone GrpE (heat shock protein)
VAAKKANLYQPVYPCADHPDEELTYYCFSCNNPICPECAIHGLHRDHEVQTTRKAIKQIKHLLVEDRQKLDLEMSEIAGNREQAKRLAKEWTEENKRDQEFVRKKMAQLKAAINEKEKDLLRSCDANLERNCEILRSEASAAEKSLEVIAGVKRNIDSTLKKEELTVLQEFNKRDDEANEALQLADREREQLREQQVKNPLRCVDTTAFDEEIDRLMGDLQALKLASAIPKQ